MAHSRWGLLQLLHWSLGASSYFPVNNSMWTFTNLVLNTLTFYSPNRIILTIQMFMLVNGAYPVPTMHPRGTHFPGLAPLAFKAQYAVSLICMYFNGGKEKLVNYIFKL